MHHRPLLLLSLLFLIALYGVACGDDDGAPSGPTARFTLSPGDDFFAQPFPCDLRLEPGGGLDLTGFPDAEALVDKMVAAAAEHSTGFAVGGAVFFSFTEAVDPATLPDDGVPSFAADATVYLVDVDPDSPGYAERIPLWIRFEAEPSRFLPPNWLALLPYPGVPLRTDTTYAAVVTDGVKTVAGETFRRDRDFARLMQAGGGAEIEAARTLFQPLLSYLDGEGIPRETVVAATVFTTQRAVDIIPRAREVIYRDVPAPTLADLSYVKDNGDVDVFEGTYEAPIFQQGDPPYSKEGGQIEVDESGDPVLVRMETLRVALAVPKGAMPADGWPVAIYRHGTGGDYLTFVENNTANRLANSHDNDDVLIGRVASLSIDGVMHGPRAGDDSGSPEERFYNFQNPLAGRDNSRQEAIDNFQLVRLAQAVDVAAAPSVGVPIRFDPDHIYYFGHSQGGITGALFVPFEPEVKAAVLSGAGAGLLLTLLRKDTEFNIPELLALVLNDDDYGPLDEFHPVLTLLQTYIEPADPLAYARFYLDTPWPEVGPRNVLLTYGIGDSYTPNLTTRAFAAAAGFAPAHDVTDPYEAMELYGDVVPLDGAVSGNVQGPAGTSTAVVVQYEPRGYDGHFVVFDNLIARRQAAAFLATEAYRGGATLLP